ncbi:MAG: hypothetical protein HQK56_21035 [Deltaproteobacteria bacterium]|nr:hypothetical protein [Deltaproteobacteria bacterium]
MFYIDDSSTPYTTKYVPARFMEWKENLPDVYNSYFLKQIMKIPASGIMYVAEYAGRPDNLSFFLYQSYQYWWLLMYYNSLTHVSQLKATLRINYFALKDLDVVFMTLITKQGLTK